MTDKFAFLTKIKLREDIEEAIMPVLKNPTGPTLRVFANGKLFPSPELVSLGHLEYTHDDENPGFGMDFFKSEDWKPYPADAPKCIIFGFVKRKEPKVDLFAGAKSEKTSVMSQGPKSPALVEAITAVYGDIFDKEKGYIDLVLSTETPIKTENEIYLIPKTLKKGTRAGETTYVRREHINLYPCEPWALSTPAVEQREGSLLEALRPEEVTN